MSRREIGSRVGAILAAGDGVIQLLGFGVYQGDEVLNEAGYPNPKLVLDNGDTVWGCECWWSSEDDIKARLAYWERHGWEVRVVSIEDARRRSEELSRGDSKES